MLYRRFPFTSAAALVVCVGAVVVFAAGVDVIHIEFFPEQLRTPSKLDDLICGAIVVAVAFGIDRNSAARRLGREVERARHEQDLRVERDRRDQELHAARLRVLKATMRTVQDIVNNFLGTVQLFCIRAEGAVASAELLRLEGKIQETAAKLKALGDQDTVTEKQMALGTGIDYESPH